MSKPKKNRFVLQPPTVAYFKPQGIPLFQLEQVVLEVDEYEALRLVDREGLQQVQAAERMKVSRATCARILESAHRKIAEALTGGKAIRIEGGSFVLGRNRYRCRECGTFWEIPLSQQAAETGRMACPRCRSEKVLDLGREVGLPLGDPGGGPGRAPGSGDGQGRGYGPGGGRGFGRGSGTGPGSARGRRGGTRACGRGLGPPQGAD
jgi:predicted DNA-binding protein (UPF0251 family)/DNA-directed RNA polymerase subunit RPC12/RpoP